MSTDEFGGIFNYSPSETSAKKDREEFYKNNFIREITFASGINAGIITSVVDLRMSGAGAEEIGAN
jgi:hypothetical protein